MFGIAFGAPVSRTVRGDRTELSQARPAAISVRGLPQKGGRAARSAPCAGVNSDRIAPWFGRLEDYLSQSPGAFVGCTA